MLCCGLDRRCRFAAELEHDEVDWDRRGEIEEHEALSTYASVNLCSHVNLCVCPRMRQSTHGSQLMHQSTCARGLLLDPLLSGARAELVRENLFFFHTLGGRRVLIRDVKRFRGGLAFKAHKLVYHSTLGSRVMKKKRKFRVHTATTLTCLRVYNFGLKIERGTSPIRKTPTPLRPP